MKTLRIGICDAVPPEFYLPDEKSDPDKFVAMFDAIEAPFTFETYDVTARRESPRVSPSPQRGFR